MTHRFHTFLLNIHFENICIYIHIRGRELNIEVIHVCHFFLLKYEALNLWCNLPMMQQKAKGEYIALRLISVVLTCGHHHHSHIDQMLVISCTRLHLAI